MVGNRNEGLCLFFSFNSIKYSNEISKYSNKIFKFKIFYLRLHSNLTF